MAKKSRKTSKTKKAAPRPWPQRLRRIVMRTLLALCGAMLLWILLYSVVPVPTTPYMLAESRRQPEGVDYRWTPMSEISPHLARAVVAAEDANFCRHWGFDMSAIRAAISEGGQRGASTISQQTVKNSFLWHGRTWSRKALEAALTPAVELFWSKRRILEVYLNVAEFDTGVFGAEAAARHYYGVGPEALTAQQAAQLAAVLPAPKDRSAGNPGPFVRRRAAQIIDGAATIERDGRAACFEH
nr:monofunctional biosynthetic peptidoglycan transglycosylase [uncultured Celeribacter sp.]